MFVRLAIFLSGILLMGSVAHAEHKLLITDVLDKSQVEASANFTYSHTYYDYTLKSPGFQQGRRTRDSLSSLYSLSFGIADGFQLTVKQPYVYHDRTTFEYISPSFPSRSFDRDGWGDLELGGKYRLLGGDGKPLTLVAGLNVKLDNADKTREGTGTRDIIPYIAAGTTMYNGALRPFVSYKAIVRNHGVNDSHLLNIGAEFVIGKDLSLAPSCQASIRTGSSTLSSYESYECSLPAFLQLFHNFYFIPSAAAGISTASHTKDGTLDYDKRKYYSVGAGLYYFFN